MSKIKMKNIGEKVFPWVLAVVIALVCVGYKHGDKLMGDSSMTYVKDSTSVDGLIFEKSNSLKNVYFEVKGKEFVDLLDYFCKKNPNLEIVSVTREVSGNPMETTGYTVVLK